MHKTLHADFKGHVDECNLSFARGWCFGKQRTQLYAYHQESETKSDIVYETRPDVARFYDDETLAPCGWTLTFSHGPGQYDLVCDDACIFTFRVPAVSGAPALPQLASFVVVDGFYQDPDSVRAFALTVNMVYHHKTHKGRRSDERYLFPGVKESFERLLGRRISNFEKYGTNGCFQFCVDGDSIVYHCDTQQYAGVLFLTPDAPPSSGTQFFRSVHTKKMKADTSEDAQVTFAAGHLDRAQFEMVDTVGNVYNRLVLFDAHLIHAATAYFGDSKENGRLFQLFFFDLEN